MIGRKVSIRYPSMSQRFNYQRIPSCWKAIHAFLRKEKTMEIPERIVLSFLPFLFHEKSRSQLYISVT